MPKLRRTGGVFARFSLVLARFGQILGKIVRSLTVKAQERGGGGQAGSEPEGVGRGGDGQVGLEKRESREGWVLRAEGGALDAESRELRAEGRAPRVEGRESGAGADDWALRVESRGPGAKSQEH